MRRITDHCLIKVSDLYQNPALRVGERTKIADVTVAANPDRGTIRELAAATAVQPFVKLDGASAHICVRRSRHFEIPRPGQNVLALLGSCQMKAPLLSAAFRLISTRTRMSHLVITLPECAPRHLCGGHRGSLGLPTASLTREFGFASSYLCLCVVAAIRWSISSSSGFSAFFCAPSSAINPLMRSSL